MTKLRVAGVPEHFNLPWHLALEAGAAARLGIEAEWRDFPDGSGAMAAALRRGDIDAALLLTEGAVAGIAAGGGFGIASLYTESPLLWGIHVPAGSKLRTVAELRGARYAISRRGSGSHLMAVVHARAEGWSAETLEFVVVRNLAGAVEAFAAGEADVFFWEKFMTQPLVDAGQFRRIGEFVAPWPAFVLCVADSLDATARRALAALLAEVQATAQALVARPDAAALIGARYSLGTADVAAWLRATRWAHAVEIVPEDLTTVIEALRELGLVAPELAASQVLTTLV